MSAADIFKIKGAKDAFAVYELELQVEHILVAGIPKDPKIAEAWIKARLELGDREIRELAEQTIKETRAVAPDEVLSVDELAAAVVGEIKTGNTFKRHPVTGNPAYEGRCMKSAIKEAANIAYPGSTFPGQPATNKRKGLKRYLAETVFVPETFIDLGPLEVFTAHRPGHPRKYGDSVIVVYDYVERPLVRCTLKVLDDYIVDEVWRRLWEVLELNGIGSDRSMGNGVNELKRFERVA